MHPQEVREQHGYFYDGIGETIYGSVQPVNNLYTDFKNFHTVAVRLPHLS